MTDPLDLDAPRTREGHAHVDPHEVRMESLISMLERERRALSASLVSLAILGIACAFYPNAAFMFVLLALRFCSFLFTRTAAIRLHRALRARKASLWPERIMVLSMVLTGATLGLMVWPAPPETPLAAMMIVPATVLVTVTLIAVTLAAMPGPRDAMLVSFFSTVCATAVFAPTPASPTVVIVALLAAAGVRTYAANAGHHIVAAAEMLVENRQLSKHLSQALAKAEYLGSRDPLTGLYNRRKLFEQREIGCSDGTRRILMIDLDRFKSINDRFGHSAGDRVLVSTAEIITMRLREFAGEHLAFRIGGEEFLLILEGLESVQAEELAESLRRDISGIGPGDAELPDCKTTASFGLAQWHPGEQLDEVLQRADAACYEAKNDGRDRVRAAA